MGSAARTGSMGPSLAVRTFLTSSLQPRSLWTFLPARRSQGKLTWTQPVLASDLPKFSLGLAQGARLCRWPMGGPSPDAPAAHLPGFLADPGWAPQPLLASCSVNMARLMVRNCQSPIGWDCFEDVLKIRTGRPAQPSAHHRMFSWQGFHRAAGNHNHRVNHS